MNQGQVEELWRLEEKFWLADADFYERTLAPSALMVLPEPAGILGRAATIDSISAAARWRHVSFKEQHQAFSGTGTAVLAYMVEADRGSADSAYAARCSTTYVRDDGQWLLLLHHQTPVGRSSGIRA